MYIQVTRFLRELHYEGTSITIIGIQTLVLGCIKLLIFACQAPDMLILSPNHTHRKIECRLALDVDHHRSPNGLRCLTEYCDNSACRAPNSPALLHHRRFLQVRPNP